MARRVRSFRDRSQPRPGLHPAERWLLVTLGLQLCFLPWALGTMRPGSQLVSVALSVTAFVLAIWPRFYPADLGGASPAFRIVPWLRLRRFPPFWLGLALIAYVAVQALNPSWRYVQTAQLWWLMQVPDVPWLPTGIAAPFARFNAWRDCIIFASAWLASCSVWVGLTRRRSLRVLLIVPVANGLVLAGLLAAQHASHGQLAVWPLAAWTPYPLSASFIYHNHAGAYFALITMAAVSLTMWYFDAGARRLDKSTPATALGLAAIFLAGAVFFTVSRGAVLTLVCGFVFFLGWLFWRRRLRPMALATDPAVTKILAALFLVFAVVAFRYLDFSEIYFRFDAMAIQRTGEESVRTRIQIHQAAEEMLSQHWLRGVGAGGFRYLSPGYVKNFPEIYRHGQLYWDHAHGDWLEFPIELGVGGDLLVLSGAAWWISCFLRRKTVWHPLAMPLLFGCGQTLVHAAFDFPFQCPAILITWIILLTVAGRAVELGE